MAKKSTRADRVACINAHSAYYSSDDIYVPTYHTNADCPRGEQVLAENLRCGFGMHRSPSPNKCKDC